MMRYSLSFLWGLIAVFGSLSLKAQNSVAGLPTIISPIRTYSIPDYQSIEKSRINHQKWFVSRYAAVSAGTVFYPGGNAYYISAPVGIQLNRQLTNNLYAFGGVYVAPTFSSFNHSFLNAPNNQFYPAAYHNANQFTVNPGVQMGLTYVNDARTFSISGSIRAEYNSYPAYPAPSAPSRPEIRK
jgi:hypothetical protein